MQKYQIIPRKFRPKRFSEIVGQDVIVTMLKNALLSERFGQAYLFCGCRGSGKTTLARLFAKALNCSARGKDLEPCNYCPSCREITEGYSLDIIEIDGASNRGIDDIRQINETVGYAPSKGSFKIYIIDEVHMLTKEAFNALLKTLEEPPKNVKFFFATTEPHKIPATIISRCQRFDLSRIPEKAMREKLIHISHVLEIEIEEKVLTQIIRLSDGSLRDAESFLDQLICFGKNPITYVIACEVFGLISEDFLQELDGVIQSMDLDKASILAQKLFTSGKDVNAILDMLLWHFRTHLLNKPSSIYSKQQCLHILDLLLRWHEHILKTPFKQVYLELLFINLAKSTDSIMLQNLIERLIALEKKIQKPQSPQDIPIADGMQQSTTDALVEQKEESIRPSKFDTLIRFAAVELEGIIQKQGS